MFLLLNLNIFYIFSSVSFVDFEQVNVSWDVFLITEKVDDSDKFVRIHCLNLLKNTHCLSLLKRSYNEHFLIRPVAYFFHSSGRLLCLY